MRRPSFLVFNKKKEAIKMRFARGYKNLRFLLAEDFYNRIPRIFFIGAIL